MKEKRVIKMWEHIGWGDSIDFVNYDNRTVFGWLVDKPEVGDTLQSKMVSGDIANFEFTEVRYETDPKDMFFGKVKDLGYEKIQI
jgi:hypothetical protein